MWHRSPRPNAVRAGPRRRVVTVQSLAVPADPVPTSRDIQVRGVHKELGGALVIDDLSLTCPAGEVTVLLGPSGSGKSTLLRLLAGLERPDAGEIVVGGAVVAGPSTWIAPEKRRIGMVFQDWALFPHLDVAANVGFGVPRAERTAERVATTLELVGLGGMEQRAPHTLSGGQQQRVALARALAPRPDVLLLDEPFSNLDAALRRRLRSEVHELLVRLGMTTVFVTHDQDEAFVLGDGVAVVRDGRVVQLGTPTEIYRQRAHRQDRRHRPRPAGRHRAGPAAPGPGRRPARRCGRRWGHRGRRRRGRGPPGTGRLVHRRAVVAGGGRCRAGRVPRSRRDGQGAARRRVGAEGPRTRDHRSPW